MAFPTATILQSDATTKTVNTLPNAGQALMANSLSIAHASDDPVVLASGAPADAAYSGSGSGGIIGLLKWIGAQLVALVAIGNSTGTSRVVGPGGWEAIAASTTQVMGGTGAIGDYLSHVIIIPSTTSPGAVQIKDGSGSAITIFAGGASSITNLVPFAIPLGLTSLAGAWSIITLTNETAIGVGNFT